ncbi:MAG: J domain-containing protein [Anaerolineales bacterium]|nr:J domain-containing protein [Anaerolineales bacterium]
MEFKDYYRILGVDKKADEKEIKRAYRKLARQYHPDKNPNNKAAEEKFKEINEAYEVLGTPENREKYDQLGSNFRQYQQMGGQPSGFDFSQWQTRPGTSYQTNINPEDLSSFSEFFSAIFGNMGQGGMGAQARSAPGRDIEHHVTISLEEAYYGTTRILQVDGERFTARIPAGAQTGSKLRLRGKGQKGPAGSGDLFLIIRVEPDKLFKREGVNLKVEVSVDLLTAVLGGKASVPTLNGPVNLTIPAGTQGGRRFRLRGKGMPNPQAKGEYGDLLVHINISVPQQLSPAERQLYEQLAALRKTQ